MNRKDIINTYIQSKGEATLKELHALHPDVSNMTIRRDLEQLERLGKIVRIRGGAKSIAHLSILKEAAYGQRQAEHSTAKMLIAKKAINILSPGRSIYIDSGTTCMCFAQQIQDENLFVLTSAPNVALELAQNSNITINLTGGQLNHNTLSLSGVNATDYVKSLNIDLAFIATSAFSLSCGFSCGDYLEAELKRLIVRKANHTIILMDSSKINQSMPYTFAQLKNVQTLITDADLPDSIVTACRQAGVLIQ